MQHSNNNHVTTAIVINKAVLVSTDCWLSWLVCRAGKSGRAIIVDINMASPILPKPRFAENKGCVLPSVKHPTCREYALAHLTQQEEHVSKLEAQKEEENQQLKQKVMDLEATLLRTEEDNLRLISELQKCQGLLREKEE